MESKTRGWINIIGAVAAIYLGWGDWSVVILGVLFLLSGYHHAFD